jgi:hypothetical protein
MPDAGSKLSVKISSKLKEFTVVDLDVHIHETPAALAPYCEMPWRKSLEHLSTVPHRYLDIPWIFTQSRCIPLVSGLGR